MDLPGKGIGVFYKDRMPRLKEPIVPYETASSAEDMGTAVIDIRQLTVTIAVQHRNVTSF
ncbi:hypothetical protein BDV09DRAFT_168793 [Aspergillus tetrazonus]